MAHPRPSFSHAPRRAGILLPLSAAVSTDSWGIGEFPDLAPLCQWLAGGGQSVLQLLPLCEMSPGSASPYASISGMAFDPVYLRLDALPEWTALMARDAGAAAAAREEARATSRARLHITGIRAVKDRLLRTMFRLAQTPTTPAQQARRDACDAWRRAEAWWLDDYALFRALRAAHGEADWQTWPSALAARDADALHEARVAHDEEIRYRAWLQWLAHTQWGDARAAAHADGVAVFGDLPFLVDGDSADVWSRQEEFDRSASVGVPPDAFSETGQDWGLPLPRWTVMAATDYQWMRDRARRMAALYDGLRVDHVVGLFRTYARRGDRTGEGTFSPAEEHDQIAQGRRVLSLLRESGLELIVEDLGVVPPSVREALAQLDLPGYRVLRWEREWDAPGQMFSDPRTWPRCAVATSGTHDTEPLAVWWDGLDLETRGAVVSVIAWPPDTAPTAGWCDAVRDALIVALLRAGAALVLLPLGDVFGWTDRINVPGTVTEENWTFRLPVPINRWHAWPVAGERQEALSAWTAAQGRLAAAPRG